MAQFLFGLMAFASWAGWGNAASLNLDQSVFLDVPFTPQAPMGNWDVDEYQYACEEASLLMAMYWAKGTDLRMAAAEEEILDMTVFQQERTGNFYDTSASDTAQLMRDYYGHRRVSVRSGVGADAVKAELLRGNIVIAPVNADVMGNPYYDTRVGAHMVVVTGYDAEAKEFVTNDPGTWRGQGFRYGAKVFDEAIRDYHTGKNIPVTSTEKRMIVVKPSAFVLY